MVASMKINGTKRNKFTQKLHRIEIAIGMKVMVTLNLATEADLANRSRGIIEDIVLDPRERLHTHDINAQGIFWTQLPTGHDSLQALPL